MRSTNAAAGRPDGNWWTRLSRWEKLISVVAGACTIVGALIPVVHGFDRTGAAVPIPAPVPTAATTSLARDLRTTAQLPPQSQSTTNSPADRTRYIAQIDSLCRSWLAEFYDAVSQGGLGQRGAMAQTIRHLDDQWRGLAVPPGGDAALAAVLAPLERAALDLQRSQAAADGANLDDSNALALQAQAEMNSFADRAHNYDMVGCADAGHRAASG
jgi:hypothetical protein